VPALEHGQLLAQGEVLNQKTLAGAKQGGNGKPQARAADY
jgi:hypothetical protein